MPRARSVLLRLWSPIAYAIVVFLSRLGIGAYLRLRVEGLERLPPGPALLCFPHQNWADPFIMFAAIPWKPRIYILGPREMNMSVGLRNRLITAFQSGIPFRPDNSDARSLARRVEAVLASGARIIVAPEGRIHAGEREILPLLDGPAFFALRTGCPIVPIGLSGTGWIHFGKTVRIRVGTPIVPAGRPRRETIAALSAELRAALLDLVADGRDEPAPGWFGRWFTELFNEWPEGSRPPLPDSGTGRRL